MLATCIHYRTLAYIEYVDAFISYSVVLTCIINNSNLQYLDIWLVLCLQKFESEIQSIAPSSPAEIREKILARQKSRRENQQHGETKHEANSTETKHEANSTETCKSEPDPVVVERMVNA